MNLEKAITRKPEPDVVMIENKNQVQEIIKWHFSEPFPSAINKSKALMAAWSIKCRTHNKWVFSSTCQDLSDKYEI